MRSSRSRASILLALGACVALLGGCAATSGNETASETAGGEEGAPAGELTVFATASVTAAFEEITALFEAAHPAVDVRPISYDGSSTLATQIVEGAPADVFASADEATMQRVVDAGLAEDPALFATNTLVIVTPAGNPAGIDALGDLADPDTTVVLCASDVPCGAAASTLLRNQGVRLTPASSEQNVTAVLTKVASGDADAGLVYATEARGRTDVEVIVPEGAAEVVNRYPIAALADAAPGPAEAFVDFVIGPEGQAVLAAYGFGAP